MKIKLPKFRAPLWLRLRRCRRDHMEHWQLIKHGHRECSKCGITWKRSSSVDNGSDRDRVRLPK